MLSRLADLYRYLIGAPAAKPPVDNFQPHPSWLALNQQRRANDEYRVRERVAATSAVSVLPPPPLPPVVREEISDEYLGVMPMDLSDDGDEPEVMSNVDVEAEYSADEESLSESEDEQLPNRWICPVSLEPIESPVTSINGHNYDRKALIELANRHPNQETITCPVTRKPIELAAITYPHNYDIKEEIAERKQEIATRKRLRQEERAKTREVIEQARARVNGDREVREKRLRFFEGASHPQRVTSTTEYGNIFTP